MSDDPETIRERLPSFFQKRVCWSALTALAMVLIGAVMVGVVYLFSWVLGQLQPVLVPIAVAGIIAYLLDPLIERMVKRGAPRDRAMMIVFVAFLVAVVALAVIVIVPSVGTAGNLYDRREEIQDSVTASVQGAAESLQARFGDYAVVQSSLEWFRGDGFSNWLKENGGEIGTKIWVAFSYMFQGALGFFGYMIGLFLVPVYLYYFLKESASIQASWSDYLPIKASRFKDEVVETLSEINGYLISFFRGQMLVSMIDGALIGITLMIMGLPYALLIGVFVALLGLIPYIGNLMCLIPALIISLVHFSAPDHQWGWLPQVWAYPVIVVVIFIVVQQINGLVTAPKIVGDSVGLHPLTVIFSVLFWSLLLGGFLGALLAVPLTAAIKVLFRRYVWERKVKPGLPVGEAAVAAAAENGAAAGPEAPRA